MVDAGTIARSEVTRIVTYEPQYADAFADLNREWIEAYFELEAEDIKVLSNPEGYVLAGGGEIFFALDAAISGPDGTDGLSGDNNNPPRVVGTVAMVKTADRVFELAKMAVSPSAQGRGISHLLMTACVDFARAQNASEIFLVTNDILLPAMGLYEKSGFVRLPKIEDARYSRGNTEMRLVLSGTGLD